VNGVLKRLFSLGVRPAAAGEFTKRAYLNGKLSLAEAEGICDLINAQSEAAAMQAYRLMTGELSQGIRAAAELLLSAEANIEAVLDYPEELADDLKEPTLRLLCQAREKLSDLLSSSQNARYLNEGVNIVIAGAPNAGKSSLLNAILKDDRAIVAETAGTTRDTLRETVEIEGIRVNITDTAGIRKSGDTLEKMGIERAKKAALGADLVVFLTDLSREESHEDADFLRSLAGKTVIIAGNKGDIARFQRQADIVIEAKNGKNVDKLLSLIAKRLDLHVAAQGAILIKERHISKVREAMAAAQSAIEGYTITPPDCTAADVKAAHRALTDVIGTDADESVVDKIFAEFCVGK
jgi:tRNA modification GTPase